MAIPTYYRLRAITVDENGRAAFTHIDIPLAPDTAVGRKTNGFPTDDCNLEEMRGNPLRVPRVVPGGHAT